MPTPTFPGPHIQAPTAPHTHTLILLHGRGSNGPEFATDLFASHNLPATFPSVRFIFPTATTQRSTVFQEDMTEWFDIYSLTIPDSRPELQLPGLCASVNYILSLLEEEIRHVGEDSTKVLLGGISQGMATASWALLAEGRELGGFVGASGWVPMAGEMEGGKAGEVVKEKLGMGGEGRGVEGLKVWLGHGRDDAYVDVEEGRRARGVFERAGAVVTVGEYEGADEEGHWLKEPEEVDDIVGFLREVVGGVGGE